MELQLNILFYTLSEGHGNNHCPAYSKAILWRTLDIKKRIKLSTFDEGICNALNNVDRKSEVLTKRLYRNNRKKS